MSEYRVGKSKFGSLKRLVVTVFVTVGGIGWCQSAVILTIYEKDGGLRYDFDGGSINTTGLVFAANNLQHSSINGVHASALGSNDNGLWGTDGGGSFDFYVGAIGVADSGGYSGTVASDFVGWTRLSGTTSLVANTSQLVITSNTPMTSGLSIDGSYFKAGVTLDSYGLTAGSTRVFTLPNDTFTINVPAQVTSVPEPTSTLLASLGLGALALRRKRTLGIVIG